MIAKLPFHGASATSEGVPTGQPVRLDESSVSRVFANSDRFPRDFVREYRRSLCDTSPAVVNAVLGQDNGSLTIRNVEKLNACAAIVLAGDQDVLTAAVCTRVLTGGERLVSAGE